MRAQRPVNRSTKHHPPPEGGAKGQGQRQSHQAGYQVGQLWQGELGELGNCVGRGIGWGYDGLWVDMLSLARPKQWQWLHRPY